MLAGKKVLAVIPARGGSKRVPRKNVRVVAGKPLLAYTIEAASRSRYVDEIVVSSDDPETLEIAALWGAIPVERPSELASDESPSMDAVLHAMNARPDCGFVALLQPTSPLRTDADIDGAIDQLVYLRAPCCVAICESKVPPRSLFELHANDRLSRILDSPTTLGGTNLSRSYVINGAVYFADASWLKRERRFLTTESVGYRMPIDRSLDIDTEFDFQFFEFLVSRNSVSSIRNSV